MPRRFCIISVAPASRTIESATCATMNAPVQRRRCLLPVLARPASFNDPVRLNRHTCHAGARLQTTALPTHKAAI